MAGRECWKTEILPQPAAMGSTQRGARGMQLVCLGRPAMHKLEVRNPEAARATLRLEAGRSAQSRFVHRLHCMLLVGAGRSCYEAARVFGVNPRSVERWVREFERHGVEGLREKPRPGRQATLADAQMRQLEVALGRDPSELGHAADAWNGELLRAEILARFGVTLSGRHCRRLFKNLQRSRARKSG
jgi:transposase